MLQSEINHAGLITPTGSCASSLSDFGWPPMAVAIPVQTFDLGVQRPQVHNTRGSSSHSNVCSLDVAGYSGEEVNWTPHSHYQPPFPFYGSTSSVGHWYSQYPHHHQHQHQQQQQQQYIQLQHNQQQAHESTNADRHWVSDPINLSTTSGNHHLTSSTHFDQHRYPRGSDGVCSSVTMLPPSSMYASMSVNDRRQAASTIAADVMSSNTARAGIIGESSSSATASKQFYVTPPSTYERTVSTDPMQSRGSSYGRDNMDARWYGAYFPAESEPSMTPYSSSSNRHRLAQLQRPNEAASSTFSALSRSAPSLCRASGDTFVGTPAESGVPPQTRHPTVMPPSARDDSSSSSLPHDRYSRSCCTATTTSSSSSGSRQTQQQFKQGSSDEDDDVDDDADVEDKHRFAFGFRPTAASMSIGKTRTREKYRTVYNERQKVNLEAEYLKNPYISAERKASISQASGLSQRQVKIWFQNRRAKDRRTRYRVSAHCTSTSN